MDAVLVHQAHSGVGRIHHKEQSCAIENQEGERHECGGQPRVLAVQNRGQHHDSEEEDEEDRKENFRPRGKVHMGGHYGTCGAPTGRQAGGGFAAFRGCKQTGCPQEENDKCGGQVRARLERRQDGADQYKERAQKQQRDGKMHQQRVKRGPWRDRRKLRHCQVKKSGLETPAGGRTIPDLHVASQSAHQGLGVTAPQRESHAGKVQSLVPDVKKLLQRSTIGSAGPHPAKDRTGALD